MPVQILIADDSRLVRIVLRNLLEQHVGWKVCAEAENGRQAVLKSRETTPSLVVLDFEMPVMNGLEAAKEIRESFPTIPIVLFTVHCIPAVQQAADQLGVQQVVDKADYGAMVTAIENLVGRAA